MGIEYLEIVRVFIKQLVEETCALFDILWTYGIEAKLEKIQEIKLNEKIK